MERHKQWNVIVMSDGGKPIFWRFGNEEEILTICGVIQALRASASASGLGDLQSMRSKERSVVFMTAGSITLVAISKQGNAEEVQLLMKLRLEYLYGQIIFGMTHQVQTVLAQNPNYDLGEALQASETLICAMLDDSGAEGVVGPFLTGAVEVLGPIASNIREKASTALFEVAQKIPDTVFAILLLGEKLVTVVQPSYLPHQLRPSDLKLLAKFVSGQARLLTSELWSPVCLPRFNSSGFLYSYSTYLHETTKLTLLLVSQINTTDQFELFRQGSAEIRKELSLPLPVDSVLKIAEQNETDVSGSSFNNDIAWERLNDPSNECGTIPPIMGGQNVQDILTNDDAYKPLHQRDEHSFRRSSLLSAVQEATDPEKLSATIERYLKLGDVLHFMFRRDVEVKTHSSKECGLLPQCFSPPLDFPFVDASSKQRVWAMYQKLCLRMRLGAATTAATWAGFNGDEAVDEEDPSSHTASTSSSAAMALVESVPVTNGMSYFVDGAEMFLAMNGHGFELYAIFPASVPVTEATSSGAKLARRLVAESGKIFLTTPLTWRD